MGRRDTEDTRTRGTRDPRRRVLAHLHNRPLDAKRFDSDLLSPYMVTHRLLFVPW